MTRSTQQNSRYWLLLYAISEKVTPRGQLFSPEVWHTWAKSRWLGCVDQVLPNGKTLSIPISTATLDVEQFNDYMTKVEAWAAEHNVWLEDRESA